MEKYIRVKDLAQTTGIKMSTWRKWIQLGTCPVKYRRAGGKRGVILFAESDVVNWLDSLAITDDTNPNKEA